VGALAFAWVLGSTGVFGPEIRASFKAVSLASAPEGFGLVFLKGIFAGWLIALMVWLLPGARSARMPIIVLLTWLVGVGGLTHVVAGSVEMFYLSTTGALSWSQALGGYVLPALLGNTVGGVALVAALNHAQVVANEG
jgi:formate/nitrite transporter FocA (FNT family)